MPKGVYSNATRKAWTAEDDMRLSDLIEQCKSDEQIAKAMGRSVNSVHVRASRTLSRRELRYMSARAVTAALGVSCSKTVTRWVDAGYIKGARSRIGAGGNRRWMVTEDALMAFVQDSQHWHRWDASRIPDPDLREWALEVRTEEYLTEGEVARRCVVGVATVRQWIDKGYLPSVRNGNHLIPASALVGFVLPSMRDRSGYTARRFTPAEDRLLLQLRGGDALSWHAIAERMGRAVGSCAGRYKRLTESGAVAA